MSPTRWCSGCCVGLGARLWIGALEYVVPEVALLVGWVEVGVNGTRMF